jgi:hypothetical protein
MTRLVGKAGRGAWQRQEPQDAPGGRKPTLVYLDRTGHRAEPLPGADSTCCFQPPGHSIRIQIQREHLPLD